MLPGPFISLDGIDGTGKSTQCRLLAELLRGWGHEVVVCADPGDTTVGNVLRELVLGKQHPLALPCEALLFMASRAQLVSEVLQPALAAGRAVISDRFTLANVVYQGHAGGLNVEELWRVGNLATGGLEPDLTIVLDLPVATAQARRNRPADRVESRARDYHERVRAGFLAEAQRRPERIAVVDASQPIPTVFEQIRGLVASRWHPS